MDGGELRQLREKLCLTQEGLGRRLGVHRVTVVRWETGARIIPDQAAAALKLLADESRQRLIERLMDDADEQRRRCIEAEAELKAARQEAAALRLEVLLLKSTRSGVVGSRGLLCEILGVDAGACGAELKRAYRRWSLSYHPDQNRERDTTELFSAVTTAYKAALVLA